MARICPAFSSADGSGQWDRVCRHPASLVVEQSVPAGRRPGRHWAGRETGGPAGRHIRPGMRAHVKVAHGGFGPVVGDVVDNRIAGAAVGAVDKRIAIAAVRGSNSSSRQSSQMDTSGEIRVKRLPCAWLFTIEKPVYPFDGADSIFICVIWARGADFRPVPGKRHPPRPAVPSTWMDDTGGCVGHPAAEVMGPAS